MSNAPRPPEPRIPALPAGARARVAVRAGAALALLALVAAAVVAGTWAERPPVAQGVLCGHALGLALTLSWLLGALLTFDGPPGRLVLWTAGLWPLRLVVLAAGLLGATNLLGVDVTALFGAFALTHVAGLVVEGWALTALTKLTALTSPRPGPAPGPAEPPAADRSG